MDRQTDRLCESMKPLLGIKYCLSLWPSLFLSKEQLTVDDSHPRFQKLLCASKQGVVLFEKKLIESQET